MKQLTYCMFTLALLASCSGGTDAKEAAGAADTTTAIRPEESGGAIEIEEPEAVPELTWKDLAPGEYDVPRTQIVLTVGDRKTILDTISNACTEIQRSEYKSYGIPQDALTAFGGWYAGGGDYFYLTQKNGKAAVYHGWQDEGEEVAGYHWKRLKL